MEQETRIKPKVAVETPLPEQHKIRPVVQALREVKQLVRTIGTVDSPETQAVGTVNETLAALLNSGWTIHTAHPVASGAGGSVVVYFLLTK